MNKQPGADASSGSQPWLELTASPHFVDWLSEQQISLAFTTYQTSKLFVLGRTPKGQLRVIERTFNRCMGLWSDGQTIWMSSLCQLWRFENVLRSEAMYQDYDRLYIPKTAHTTGYLDIHDIVVDANGRVVFVVTMFNCLATLSERYSFTPLWRPPFVSKLISEDRCHLNGLSLESGRPRYVTAVSRSDKAEGWREGRRYDGCVIEVPSGRVVAEGLSMPHSPRIHHNRLWLLNSGAGEFGSVDLDTGAFTALAFCPGYLRGLAFTGNYAVIGLSLPRHDKSFAGLPLDEELVKHKAEPICGLQVIDLRSGTATHWVRLGGIVGELYDVVTLPGVKQPMVLGVQSDEVQRTISIDDERTL